VTYDYSDTVPKNGLIGTNRSGAVAKGSEIGVVVSKGPKPQPKPDPTPSPTPTESRRPRR
jgi:serine/threonine-protein kinase